MLARSRSRRRRVALSLLLTGATLVTAGGCARSRAAADDDVGADAGEADAGVARNVAPALAGPCGIPTAVPADWKEVRRLEELTFRVPPNYAAAPADPWAATYRKGDAHLNVWTWSGKKWVFPPLVPGRSNRCAATVNGQEVDIEVVQLDVHDGTLTPSGSPIPQSSMSSGRTSEVLPRRPRLPVYLATATWRDQRGGRYVYMQLRSTLRRDMEQFPTLVSGVTF